MGGYTASIYGAMLFWWCTVHVLAGPRRHRHSLMFVVHSFDVSASPLAKEVRAKPSLFYSPLLSYQLSTWDFLFLLRAVLI